MLRRNAGPAAWQTFDEADRHLCDALRDDAARGEDGIDAEHFLRRRRPDGGRRGESEEGRDARRDAAEMRRLLLSENAKLPPPPPLFAGLVRSEEVVFVWPHKKGSTGIQTYVLSAAGRPAFRGNKVQDFR